MKSRSTLPLATGAGLAIAHKGLDEVVVCQMGDATTNIGAWHESLNIAQLWKLPVIFLIVNNQFGMGTSVEKGSAVAELYKKACAFDMHAERVDGNDVLAVRDATLRAVDLAREEKLPSVLEAFVNVNPISITTDAARSLMAGDPNGGDIGISLAVAAGLTLVFAPLTSHLYRTRS